MRLSHDPAAIVDEDSEARDPAAAWDARARQGDREALAALFAAHSDKLRRWLELRLDPRLRTRVSSSDLVQDVFLAAEQRLEHYRERPDMPFAVWVRLLAGQRLIEARRRHLGAVGRAAGREVSLGPASPETSAINLAAELAGDLSSPSRAVIRLETHEQLVRAIDAMDPIDREVLTLRHFDEMTNDEVAQLLGISRGTASKRYVRALGRLKTILEQIPGLLDGDDSCP